MAPTAGPHGRSGHSTSRVTLTASPSLASAASKFSRTAGCTFSVQPLGTATRSGFVGFKAAVHANDRPEVVGSSGSGPAIAAKTSAQSSAVRPIGPSLSSVQHSAMAPWRETRPYVGRSPVTPEKALGVTLEPEASLPTPNRTRPAATQAPRPLD